MSYHSRHYRLAFDADCARNNIAEVFYDIFYNMDDEQEDPLDKLHDLIKLYAYYNWSESYIFKLLTDSDIPNLFESFVNYDLLRLFRLSIMLPTMSGELLELVFEQFECYSECNPEKVMQILCIFPEAKDDVLELCKANLRYFMRSEEELTVLCAAFPNQAQALRVEGEELLRAQREELLNPQHYTLI